MTTFFFSHLDHVVATTDDLDAPTGQVPAPVAGVVHAFPSASRGRRKRVLNETLRCFLGHIEVADG